jgi:hypothetical protein
MKYNSRINCDILGEKNITTNINESKSAWYPANGIVLSGLFGLN